MTRGLARTSWDTPGHLLSGTGHRLLASLLDSASYFCWPRHSSCWQPRACCAADAAVASAASTPSLPPSEPDLKPDLEPDSDLDSQPGFEAGRRAAFSAWPKVSAAARPNGRERCPAGTFVTECGRWEEKRRTACRGALCVPSLLKTAANGRVLNHQGNSITDTS